MYNIIARKGVIFAYLITRQIWPHTVIGPKKLESIYQNVKLNSVKTGSSSASPFFKNFVGSASSRLYKRHWVATHLLFSLTAGAFPNDLALVEQWFLLVSHNVASESIFINISDWLRCVFVHWTHLAQQTSARRFWSPHVPSTTSNFQCKWRL